MSLDKVDNVFVHNVKSDDNGFGMKEILNFVKIATPDIIFIYNDPNVVHKYLKEIEHYICQKWAYVDLVYPYMNSAEIDYIQSKCDKIFIFEENIAKTIPLTEAIVLNHAVNQQSHNISKKCACEKLGLHSNIFYVLNLNRNTSRKRYDIFIKSVVHFYATYKITDVKFIIGTNVNGEYNLRNIFKIECVKKHIELNFDNVFITISNPQQLDDSYIDLLYCAADIGINTCDGEGWGLCNFEHMAYGKPQIVPKHSCFQLYCNDQNSKLISYAWSYYINNRNGGEASVCSHEDFSKAVCEYYNDRNLLQSHGVAAKKTVNEYQWHEVIKPFIQQIESVEL